MARTSIDSLREQVRGPIVTPADDAYDEARRVYNGMIDRRPAAVIEAVDVADVIAAVRFAAEGGWDLALRGGGHSVPGYGTTDDGIVIDLGGMRGIRVDPAARSVRVEGGCTWGDVDHATNVFAMATPSGVVSTTGVAGLTLGGGMGHLSRPFGLTCDNLLSADVVTADGRLLTCSADEHADLFWALRGGGGNFGVVTSFEYRLHPVGTVFAGPTFFEPGGQVLRSFRELLADAPDELGLIFAYALCPPAPFVPEAWHTRPVAAVLATWTGPLDEGETWARRVAELGTVVGQGMAPMPFPVMNSLFDALLPEGLHHYWKGNFARELTDEAIKVHAEHGPLSPTLPSGAFVYAIDGACHRVGPGDTAFAYRDADVSTVITAVWEAGDDADSHISWVREYYDALRPYSEDGGYVNFMGTEDADKVRANYRQNYERLAQVKAAYDPGNLFHVNHNIPPAG